MTYKDFLSEVEKNKELMIKGGLLSTPNQLVRLNFTELRKNPHPFHETNKSLKFKDLEVGKIYVFWTFRDYGDRIINKTWFIKPTELKSPEDYSLYWCYYDKIGELKTQPIKIDERDNSVHHKRWSGYIWASKDWLRLDSLYPMKQIVINWNNLPWSDLK